MRAGLRSSRTVTVPRACRLAATWLGMTIGLASIAVCQEASPSPSASRDVDALGESQDQDQDRDRDRLGLADLAAYRAALAGRATGDRARSSDPPAQVGFRELWKAPDDYRGRRVTVRGRIERTFRQGAVGSFPPLVEAWVFTASGDPLCVVYPRSDEGEREGAREEVPAPGQGQHPLRLGDRAAGQSVEFTGTFLKMVRYAAGDGDRLAPLIVGDRPPALVRAPGGSAEARAAEATGEGDVLRAIGGEVGGVGQNGRRSSWSRSNWILGLTMAAVAVAAIAAQHLRGARMGHRANARDRGREREREGPDPPLQFVDRPDGPGPK